MKEQFEKVATFVKEHKGEIVRIAYFTGGITIGILLGNYIGSSSWREYYQGLGATAIMKVADANGLDAAREIIYKAYLMKNS